MNSCSPKTGPDAPADSAGVTSLPLTRGMNKLWQGRSPIEVGTVEPGPKTAPLVARVLAARGLTDAAAIAVFMEPSLKRLHDPSLIPDLDRAAERLLSAANKGEPIVIYGDYDVDGITATAILYHTIKAIRPEAVVNSYVPHRIDEGYGLNSDAIRELATGGAKVIVSVDCGITAVQPAAVAMEMGLDLIITDHHHPPAAMSDLPRAYAVVHPRRPDSAYPFGELCGAGVAYKLAWRLCTLACGARTVSEDLRGLLLELLALCALGVIADVVPLVDENRVITRFGLSKIKTSRIVGLRALVVASGLDGEKVNAEDVGFKLAPRLNACGRMGHAREAVELLTTAKGERATAIANQLSRQNNDRRAVEKAIYEQAAEMAEREGMTGNDRRAIVLAHPDWHAGVVGIVCSRLVERFHRPTILLSAREECFHGSARSVEGFNLHDGLVQCHEHLSGYGGHEMAAGMRVERAKFAGFVAAFIGYCNERIAPSELVGRVSYDCDAALSELSMPVVKVLAGLGPFGRGNPGVAVRLRGVMIYGRPTTFGSENNHLSFFVGDANDRANAQRVRVYGWKWAEMLGTLPTGKSIDLLVKPQINTWGAGRLECELIDVAQ